MPIINLVYEWHYEWKPWANTVAYYPLTSTSTNTDLSWNSKNMTTSWMTWGNYAWVDCANSDNWYIYRNDLIFTWTGDFTINLYVYRYYDNNEYENILFIWTSGGYNSLSIWVYNDTLWTFWWSNDHNSNYGINTKEWYNLCLTRSWNTWTLYVNWTAVDTWTVWFNPTSWNSYIGRWFGSENKRPWYISKVILENKARTAQEVSDYYNFTKSTYSL